MDSSKHPLEAMVTRPKLSTSDPPQETIDTKPKAPKKIELSDQYRNLHSTIDLSAIDRPALLIDDQLNIVWQNPNAAEKIWHNADLSQNDLPPQPIFDLIFDPVFKRSVANFSHCLDFFLFQILAIITKNQLLERIEVMGGDRKIVLLSLIERIDPLQADETSPGRYFHQTLRNGDMLSFEVFATNIGEKRLLVFDLREDGGIIGHIEHIHPIKKRFEPVGLQPKPINTPFVLLAGQLNKAATLRTQMLASEYCRLINDLCERCLAKIESYGGIFGKNIESGFFGYFLLDPSEQDDPMYVIECALEIKELMIDIGREWKIRKEWSHDIELNMGLHWEHEHIGIISSASGEIVTSFGDGLQIVGSICQLAQDGQIWATKTLIHQLSTESHKHLRFGILQPGNQRHRPFIRNGFNHLKDALDIERAKVIIEDTFKLLPVTQIFDLSGSGS